MSNEEYQRIEKMVGEQRSFLRNVMYGLVSLFGVSVLSAMFWAGGINKSVKSMEVNQRELVQSFNHQAEKLEDRVQKLESMIYWIYGKEELNPKTRGGNDDTPQEDE